MRACTAVFVCLLSAYGAQSSLSDDTNPNIIRSSAEIEGRETKTQVRCRKDSDCGSRQYCERGATLHSVCTNCQQKRRRCHSDNMCCPGMRCVNGQNTLRLTRKRTEVTNPPLWLILQFAFCCVISYLCTRPKKMDAENNKNRQPSLDNRRKQKGQERDKCVRSRDCGAGLCCTRYLEEKRCLRVPVEGERCLLPGRSKGQRALGRCDCAQGLSCRPLTENYNSHGVCQASEKQT
ncbi:dickkopf-related protein 4-like isoform X1 [Anguilla rostrata]|uniref:dickkopf-related protein 4-like isoform X1 n=1 Tax=Anguilla rostrata TaxID=7938 RepID=UPI0030CD8BC6